MRLNCHVQIIRSEDGGRTVLRYNECMGSSRKNRFISAVPVGIISFFRRRKSDNFIAGLLIGVVVSLFVNIFTIHVQESIAKQRALEAVERELVQQIIDANSVANEENELKVALKDGKHLYYPNSMSKRLENRVWNSTEVLKYIFELSPSVSAKLSSYYSTRVESTNNFLDQTQNDFNEIYNTRCRQLNQLVDSNFVLDQTFCDALILKQMELVTDWFVDIHDNLKDALTDFHPTQDRLDSFWLRTLLGGESVKILKK